MKDGKRIQLAIGGNGNNLFIIIEILRSVNVLQENSILFSQNTPFLNIFSLFFHIFEQYQQNIKENFVKDYLE